LGVDIDGKNAIPRVGNVRVNSVNNQHDPIHEEQQARARSAPHKGFSPWRFAKSRKIVTPSAIDTTGFSPEQLLELKRIETELAREQIKMFTHTHKCKISADEKLKIEELVAASYKKREQQLQSARDEFEKERSAFVNHLDQLVYDAQKKVEVEMNKADVIFTDQERKLREKESEIKSKYAESSLKGAMDIERQAWQTEKIVFEKTIKQLKKDTRAKDNRIRQLHMRGEDLEFTLDKRTNELATTKVELGEVSQRLSKCESENETQCLILESASAHVDHFAARETHYKEQANTYKQQRDELHAECKKCVGPFGGVRHPARAYSPDEDNETCQPCTQSEKHETFQTPQEKVKLLDFELKCSKMTITHLRAQLEKAEHDLQLAVDTHSRDVVTQQQMQQDKKSLQQQIVALTQNLDDLVVDHTSLQKEHVLYKQRMEKTNGVSNSAFELTR